jgi:glycosyltransferase involved in cell wall biosynthesis
LTDNDLEIPTIPPVAEGVPRPRWSVMIPTYNATRTIAETLNSVLDQALPEDEMQIAVVDNVSTDETLAVVDRIVASHASRRQIEIHRNPSNFGMVGNFNACLRLARGELVHLLHADDTIRPGFYAAVEPRMRQHPEADICASRVLTIDADGELEYITNRLARAGNLTVYDVAYENQLYPPGVVVRRTGYERVGGYSNVISYLPDWEMWTRLLEHRPGVFINELLACYRQTPGNATDYFSRSATDVRDMMRFGDVLERRVPGFSHDQWRKCMRRHAEWGMRKWREAGDEAGFRANQEVLRKIAARGSIPGYWLARAKELGKHYERILRKAIWRKPTRQTKGHDDWLSQAKALGRQCSQALQEAIWYGPTRTMKALGRYFERTARRAMWRRNKY